MVVKYEFLVEDKFMVIPPTLTMNIVPNNNENEKFVVRTALPLTSLNFASIMPFKLEELKYLSTERGLPTNMRNCSNSMSWPQLSKPCLIQNTR